MSTGYFSNLTSFDADQSFYGQSYFEGHKAQVESGYDEYASGPWVAWLATLVGDLFAPSSLLDVGCARGYLVSQLRAAGIPAYGTDYSAYALCTAPDSTAPLALADAAALPFRNGAADMVLCVETLEHLHPLAAPVATREIARIARRYVLVSTPSFGIDVDGTVGQPLEDPEHIADAQAGRPFRKLILDADGQPHCGHLTLATWQWWRTQFEQAGLRRDEALERELRAHRLACAADWHFYVFAQPAALAPAMPAAQMLPGHTPLRHLGPGWHGLEATGNGQRYRWIDAYASLSLTYCGQTSIELQLAGPPHSSAIEVSVANLYLGRYGVWPGWHTLRLNLPAALPNGLVTVELRATEPFMPALTLPNSTDQRTLGVAVARVALF